MGTQTPGKIFQRKFYGILAGILTAAVAGSGVGYHVIAASGTADQTEEDTQIDETDGQEDGSFFRDRNHTGEKQRASFLIFL